MARYTIELGELIESGFSLDLDDEAYPIFDENYRQVLNTLFIDHFRFREIGQETPELFKFMLHRRLREIMPYYNKLFESALIEFNPLFSQDIESSALTDVKRTGTSNENSSTESENDSTGRSLASTTPQTQLMGNHDYATGLSDTTTAAITTSSGSSDVASNDSSITDYVYKVSGYTGQNPSDAVMRYRQSLINVNVMLLNALETQFMGLW